MPERRYVPLTSAEAVIRYAGDFIPSWAGAISIDLLPAVLVGIMCVVHGAMRRGEDEIDEADRITAGDMMRSIDLHEALLARRRASAEAAATPEAATPAGEQPPRDNETRRRERDAAHLGRTQAERSMSQTHAMPGDLPGDTPRKRNVLVRYFSRFDDGEVVRWAFRGLLIGIGWRAGSRPSRFVARERLVVTGNPLDWRSVRPDPASGGPDRCSDPAG